MPAITMTVNTPAIAIMRGATGDSVSVVAGAGPWTGAIWPETVIAGAADGVYSFVATRPNVESSWGDAAVNIR